MGPKCKSHPDFTIDILSKITQHLDDILGFSKETHHFHPFPILTSMILYVFEFRSQGEKMRETLTIFHHLPSSSIIFHHLPFRKKSTKKSLSISSLDLHVASLASMPVAMSAATACRARWPARRAPRAPRGRGSPRRRRCR